MIPACVMYTAQHRAACSRTAGWSRRGICGFAILHGTDILTDFYR